MALDAQSYVIYNQGPFPHLQITDDPYPALSPLHKLHLVLEAKASLRLESSRGQSTTTFFNKVMELHNCKAQSSIRQWTWNKHKYIRERTIKREMQKRQLLLSRLQLQIKSKCRRSPSLEPSLHYHLPRRAEFTSFKPFKKKKKKNLLPLKE